MVAAAIGSGDDEPKLSAEAGAILGRWCTALTQAFANDGFNDDDAASLAVMSIAALEGADRAVPLDALRATAEPGCASSSNS